MECPQFRRCWENAKIECRNGHNTTIFLSKSHALVSHRERIIIKIPSVQEPSLSP